MAVLKCKMCGGELDIIDDSNVVECEYCGSKQTIPDVDDEKKLRLYDRANKLRMACDYDKASGVYESIVAEFPDEAEAYWGLILCKYGIEYVDDPATGKKIPTCHRSSFDSVMGDPNFDMVMENADFFAVDVYRAEAKQIEEIRKGIVEISNTAEDYDIFICYKETAEDGDRTIDSVIAQDVYDALTAKGYKVFFARVSLEDKLGQEYEPYIFSALNTAEVMLVFGTDYKYFNAVWVKNEWSRFLKLMEKDPKKSLIPCYKNIDAYDMPKEFARLQAQDMGKIGAVQDLIRGIEKLIGSKVKNVVNDFSYNENSFMGALTRRGYYYLEEDNYESADLYFDRALDDNPEDYNAYVGKVLVELREKNMDELSRRAVDLTSNMNFNRALRFAYSDSKQDLMNVRAKTKRLYDELKERERLEIEEKKRIESEEKKKHYEELKQKNIEWMYNRAISVMELAEKSALSHQYVEAADMFQDILDYKDSKEKYEECIRLWHIRKEEIEKENVRKKQEATELAYQTACKAMCDATNSDDYRKVTQLFCKLGDYKDSKDKYLQSQEISNKLNEMELRKQEEEKQNQIKNDRKMKNQCQYCGSDFKGLFKKICSSCGKEKDY